MGAVCFYVRSVQSSLNGNERSLQNATEQTLPNERKLSLVQEIIHWPVCFMSFNQVVVDEMNISVNHFHSSVAQ